MRRGRLGPHHSRDISSSRVEMFHTSRFRYSRFFLENVFSLADSVRRMVVCGYRKVGSWVRIASPRCRKRVSPQISRMDASAEVSIREIRSVENEDQHGVAIGPFPRFGQQWASSRLAGASLGLASPIAGAPEKGDPRHAKSLPQGQLLPAAARSASLPLSPHLAFQVSPVRPYIH